MRLPLRWTTLVSGVLASSVFASSVFASSVLVSSVLVSGLLLVVSPAAAQHPVPHAGQSSLPDSGTAMNPAPVAPFADPIESRNVAGHGAFALPLSYGQCVSALRLAQHAAAQRDSSQDTLPASLQLPPAMPPSVRAMGETCRTRVATGVTPGLTPIPATAELQSAFELAIMLGDSTGSVTALERWLAAPQTLGDRGESSSETRVKRLMIAVPLYLDYTITGPIREFGVARARTVVARLDSMGPPAHGARLAVQEWIVDAEMWWRNQTAGRYTEPERALRDYLALLPAYDSLRSTEVMTGYSAGLGTIMVQMRAVQAALNEDRVVPLLDSLVTHPSGSGNVSKGAAEALADWKYMNATVGQSVPSLHAQFWYTTEGDSVWPVPGHVSLLLVGGDVMGVEDGLFLRRVAHRYAAHGLRIALVAKTQGYWNKSGTETGPRTAAQEAVQDSAYYLGYRKLPITLAIQETPFMTKPPEGFVVQSAPVPYERDWMSDPGGSFVLVDASGRILKRWAGFNEPYVMNYFDRLFGIEAP